MILGSLLRELSILFEIIKLQIIIIGLKII